MKRSFVGDAAAEISYRTLGREDHGRRKRDHLVRKEKKSQPSLMVVEDAKKDDQCLSDVSRGLQYRM